MTVFSQNFFLFIFCITYIYSYIFINQYFFKKYRRYRQCRQNVDFALLFLLTVTENYHHYRHLLGMIAICKTKVKKSYRLHRRTEKFSLKMRYKRCKKSHSFLRILFDNLFCFFNRQMSNIRNHRNR